MTEEIKSEHPVTPAHPGVNGASGTNGRGHGAPLPPTEPVAAGTPSAAGHAVTSAPTAPATRRSSGKPRVLLVALLAIVLGAGSTVGYRWYYDSTHFVSTDNAQLAGRLMQVGPLVAGRIASVNHDVGGRVVKDEVVATLRVPVPASATTSGTPRLEFRDTQDTLVEVTAPASGIVVARGANPGDTVPAGQPVLTVVDPRQLWVNANVEETQIRRIKIGQGVDVHVDALDAELRGHVAAVTPASAATFSLLPSQNLSGNFTKVTQLVPVKIELDQPDLRLMIGTSVSVKIHVAD